jgi:hypothetical protein
MIQEISIAGLNNDPIKVKKPNIPQSNNKDLPRFFFNMLLVAQKHSGKTFLLAKLIKNYQKTKILDDEGNIHKVRVILFAPTAFSESNKIFETLNVEPNDIHVNYSDDQLLNVLDEIKQENEEIKEYKKKLELYEKFKRVKNIHELSDDEVLELHMFKFNKHHIEKHKHEHERINFLIFDDIIGTNNGAFRKSGSALQNLIIKNRHHFTNVILTTQYIKSINPIIRENIDIWCLYKSQNKKALIEKIYELVSGVVSEQHFIELFEHATEKPYSAFVIDNHKETPKENKFKINWNTILRIN